MGAIINKAQGCSYAFDLYHLALLVLVPVYKSNHERVGKTEAKK
jgi:hypothetical protein